MKKRSSYRPRVVQPDNMAWILSGMKRVGTLPEVGVNLKVSNMTALDAIVMGEGTGLYSHTLREAFELAVQMPKVRASLGRDWLPELSAALKATNAMHDRGERTGRYLFTGPEMQAVKAGMEIHIQQIDECTVDEMVLSVKLAAKAKAEELRKAAAGAASKR